MAYTDRETQDDFPVSAMRSGMSRKLPQILPVLPVRDTVYFPNMLFPLFLGREKSIRALDYALEKHRYLLLVAQRDISVEEPGPQDMYEVGIIAEVMQVLRVPDGTVRITLEGVRRARIVKLIHRLFETCLLFYKTGSIMGLVFLRRENMADKLDPAVQIRIIDLAEKISQSARSYKNIMTCPQ